MPTAAVLRVGARLRFDGRAQTVVGLSGTLVRLVDEQHRTCVIHLPHLLRAEGFEHLGERVRSSLLPAGMLHALPQEAIDEATWWERHIVEVITGMPPEEEASASPRLGYDPARRSLREREEAKVTELAAQGRQVSLKTLQRKRQRYQEQGLAGLVDWRVDAHRAAHGRVDQRVVEALGEATDEATQQSTRTTAYLRWRVEQILTERFGPGVVEVPPRATFYRLVAKVSAGRHTTGSARTRRSLANRPPGAFGTLGALQPGEVMQIDSTPLDVLVLLDDGVSARVELTGMIDLATRSITAAVLRPTTKSVDAALLLARTVTPEPMRPGWTEALQMARSVLPHRRLLELDERLEHAAARPVIVPGTIVCDRGSVFLSHNFRTACATLGINFQAAHPYTPTDKPHIERTLGSVSTLFCQFVSGYLGRSAEHRGHRVEDEPLWSLMELQELLDEWVVAVWQNRPHDGLRDPVTPGRAYTPNQKYAALVESCGYLPLALSAQDYIELLPARWQAINAYGIKINHRIYDSDELNPFRRQPSGVASRKNLWEVHYDPYDVTRIWVRNHHANHEADGGHDGAHANAWITLRWRYLDSVPAPFGELAWDHVRRQLHDDGQQATEAEIARAVAALLAKANHGPDHDPPFGNPDTRPEQDRREGSKADRTARREQRVLARTRATSTPTWPRPGDPDPCHPAVTDAAGQRGVDTADEEGEADEWLPPDGEDGAIAKVVPLPVFDARKEAERWW